jgi:hypothetical protein
VELFEITLQQAGVGLEFDVTTRAERTIVREANLLR